MKNLKKTIASLALAAMLLPTLVPTNAIAQAAQEEGPIEAYISCVEKCMDKYSAWSLRLSACSMDCYIGIYSSVIRALIP